MTRGVARTGGAAALEREIRLADPPGWFMPADIPNWRAHRRGPGALVAAGILARRELRMHDPRRTGGGRGVYEYHLTR